MAYSDFTLEKAEQDLGIVISSAYLFPNIIPQQPPGWLIEWMAENSNLNYANEKSRSENLVTPVLRAARKIMDFKFEIYSGQPLHVDAKKGLTGECDFLLGFGPQIPLLRGAIASIVEAKRDDIEAGYGQCIAQMYAASIHNANRGLRIDNVYGCVTNGELWKFLKLSNNSACIDQGRYLVAELQDILGVWKYIIDETQAAMHQSS